MFPIFDILTLENYGKYEDFQNFITYGVPARGC
jgi:hypothetical protein